KEFEEVAGNSPAQTLSGQAAATLSEGESQRKSGAGMIALWITLGLLFGAGGFYVLWRYRHREEYEE
ncbi:MAG: hypothetical protein AABY26_02625, partial [Nanoarchaeota archaeon]